MSFYYIFSSDHYSVILLIPWKHYNWVILGLLENLQKTGSLLYNWQGQLWINTMTQRVGTDSLLLEGNWLFHRYLIFYLRIFWTKFECNNYEMCITLGRAYLLNVVHICVVVRRYETLSGSLLHQQPFQVAIIIIVSKLAQRERMLCGIYQRHSNRLWNKCISFKYIKFFYISLKFLY